jgi:hypothetical protein
VHRRFLLHLLLLWLAGNALRLTILAVPPVIPSIHNDLDLSATGVGILGGLPVVMFAAIALASAGVNTRRQPRQRQSCTISNFLRRVPLRERSRLPQCGQRSGRLRVCGEGAVADRAGGRDIRDANTLPRWVRGRITRGRSNARGGHGN